MILPGASILLALVAAMLVHTHWPSRATTLHSPDMAVRGP